MSTANTATPAPTNDLPAPVKTVAKPAAKKISAAKPLVRKSTAGKAPAKKAAVKAPQSKTVAPAKSTQPVSTAKPVSTPKPVKTVKTVKLVKAEKPKKPKLVRDSFTIPKLEYVVLEALKQRANQLKRPVKKSELLRAGIKALAALADTAFLNALGKVPAIKTGRPASGK
jgi:hypothetical protein